MPWVRRQLIGKVCPDEFASALHQIAKATRVQEVFAVLMNFPRPNQAEGKALLAAVRTALIRLHRRDLAIAAEFHRLIAE